MLMHLFTLDIIIYISEFYDKISWGASTNSRNEIIERNNEIKKKKKNGATIDELMAEYHLSYDTIKSIIYRKK